MFEEMTLSYIIGQNYNVKTVFISTFYQFHSWNFNTCLDRLGLD